jgi:uncharacterized repeat protein (TIGR01451 family)
MKPGSTITYTLTARNISKKSVVGASAIDDLSKVVSHATLDTPLAAGLTRSGSLLTWAIPTIPVGGSVTVSYRVHVDPDAIGVTLTNVATPKDPDALCANCKTTNVTDPAWTLRKSADPASGSKVDPGSKINYTLTATNTGAAAITGARATDDLSSLLPYADVRTPLPSRLTRSGPTLTWAIPTIAVGKSVTVSFAVTVHDDASQVTVVNLAKVASPNGSCVSCRTHHWVRPGAAPLADTGVPTERYLFWAGLLLLVGAVLLTGGRRRRTD